MESWPTTAVVAAAGGIGGIVLGLAARLGRFCTLAAIEDAMFGRDYRRLRMWALALAIAIAGVSISAELGLIDTSKSLYHRLALNPVAWILGGLLFGIGMAFCGTCAYGTLARVGGGDLRALFVFLVLGISAYMAIAGPTAELRLSVLNLFTIAPAGDSPHTLTELVSPAMQPVLALGVAALLALWSLADTLFRRSLRNVGWAIAVGLTILSGWLVNATLGADPFDPQPLMSYTYSVPLGQTVLFLMTMSSSALTFGIGATFGVIVGAFAGALLKREFRWEAADDAREMKRHLVGAFLMGTGGVFAGGCTIGQGLSAASILTISAPVVMLSIWCGVWLGLSYLMEGSFMAAFRSVVGR